VSESKPDLASLRIDRSSHHGPGPGWWFWVSLVLLMAAGAGAAWWYLAGPAVKTVRAATAVERASTREGTTVLNASGYVTARRRATVSSKVTGKVVEVNVEEGMRVRVECRRETIEVINVENGETSDEDRALVVDVVVVDA